MNEKIVVHTHEDSVHHSHWCPACGHMHSVPVRGTRGPVWAQSGGLDKPTYAPSIKVTSGHYNEGHIGDCWCNYEQRFGQLSPFKCSICHYHIVNGQIIFCPDSTHHLAGQTIDLPDIPELQQ